MQDYTSDKCAKLLRSLKSQVQFKTKQTQDSDIKKWCCITVGEIYKNNYVKNAA